MATPTLEERMSTVEDELTRLKQRLEGAPTPSGCAWWTRIAGVYKDSTEFEEAARLGQDYRRSLLPPDENEP